MHVYCDITKINDIWHMTSTNMKWSHHHYTGNSSILTTPLFQFFVECYYGLSDILETLVGSKTSQLMAGSWCDSWAAASIGAAGSGAGIGTVFGNLRICFFKTTIIHIRNSRFCDLGGDGDILFNPQLHKFCNIFCNMSDKLPFYKCCSTKLLKNTKLLKKV